MNYVYCAVLIECAMVGWLVGWLVGCLGNVLIVLDSFCCLSVVVVTLVVCRALFVVFPNQKSSCD